MKMMGGRKENFLENSYLPKEQKRLVSLKRNRNKRHPPKDQPLFQSQDKHLPPSVFHSHFLSADPGEWMWWVEPGALVRWRATPNIVSLTLTLSLPNSERLVSEQCQPKLSRHRRFGWSDYPRLKPLPGSRLIINSQLLMYDYLLRTINAAQVADNPVWLVSIQTLQLLDR